MRILSSLLMVFFVAAVGLGCDSDDNGNGNGGNGGNGTEAGTGGNGGNGSTGGPVETGCQASSDCAGDGICIRQGDASFCTMSCDLELDECSASAECTGAGTLELNVCAKEPETPSSPEAPPELEELPVVACKTDRDCSMIEPGSVCAQWKDQRDCTILCQTNNDCKIPSVGGVTIDLFSCQTDEGDTSRTACLPKEECFTNPMSCISMGGNNGFPGFGDDELPDFGF